MLLEMEQQMEKFANVDGQFTMMKEIRNDFTHIVKLYAFSDQELKANIKKAHDQGEGVEPVLEAWFNAQLPTITNNMALDLFCHACGFVDFNQLAKDLLGMVDNGKHKGGLKWTN